MDTITIQEAAATTGWSARMLRYIDQIGLVAAGRSDSGYRLYGAAQLQRLRTLRELLDRHQIGLGEVGFAARLRTDAELRTAIDTWLTATAVRPASVLADNWLRWEQDKHQRLLAQASRPEPVAATPTPPD